MRARCITAIVVSSAVKADNPEAVAFAKAVREALLTRGFTLKAFA